MSPKVTPEENPREIVSFLSSQSVSVKVGGNEDTGIAELCLVMHALSTRIDCIVMNIIARKGIQHELNFALYDYKDCQY